MSKKVYEGLWRAKWTTDGAKTLEEAAQKLENAATCLRELSRDGAELRDSVCDDYGFFETTDPECAKKHGMVETMFEDEDDGNDGPPHTLALHPTPR